MLQLRAQGLGYRRILKRIHEEFGERLSFATVSFWCRGTQRTAGKVGYELKASADLGALLGALKGDGKKCFRHGKGPTMP